MSWMLANYGVDFEIDITPHGSARTFVPICDGFDNVTEALNEQVQEYFSLCAKGYGLDEVVAIHPSFALTGVRKVGDPAQDFIFRNRFNLMAGRHTNLRYSEANADGTITRYTIDVTMKNVSSIGGASTAGAAVAVTFSFNGRPVIETVAPSASLTVTSVAGATSGTTVLTAVPTFPDAGCKFVYAFGDTAPAATAGSVLTDWNDFVNGATYQIASGKKATVAMVNVSTFIVAGSGNATVVAAT
jgi:hypothetical protein